MVVIVQRDYFESYLAAVYAGIFSGCSIAGGCFVEESWEMALLPGGFKFAGSEFAALAAGARQVGDLDYIVTDIALDPPHQKTALVSWSQLELEYVRVVAALLFDSAMFGLSARWGVYVGTIATPSCVGGDREFMEAFFACVGGRDAAKRRFLDWAEAEWELEPEYRLPILDRVWRSG